MATLDKVKDILVEQLGADRDTITLETDIQKDLNADSIAAMELIVEIESEFGVEVPDDQLLEIKTVGDIVSRIDELS
jgi:acyl carrier protein